MILFCFCDSSPANWMKVGNDETKKKKDSPLKVWTKTHLNLKYIHNNLVKILFMIFLLLSICGFFILGCVRYRDRNGFVIVARGCGSVLNYVCAIIVVFMLRRTLTWLRNTFLGPYLPIDDSIPIHKFVGYCIFFFSILHTIMHLINIGK